MGRARILIIEDATELATVLWKTLDEEGFEAKVAPDGATALKELDAQWNLVILDLRLPDLNGETLLQYISRREVHPPVLVITARDRLEDKLSLFRQGCDDYLTKPFDIEELLARVDALLRRSVRSFSTSVQFEDLHLDPSTYTLAAGDAKIALTPKESAICQVLMQTPGKVVSRLELLHSVWGLSAEPNTNFLGVHLINLRKKLSHLGREDWLQTIRSSGVVMKNPSEAHGT